MVVNSATSVEAGRAVAAELGGATYVQADVSVEADCTRLVEEVVAAHGRLDVLVNNAGTTAVIPHGDLEAATPDVWRRIFDVNVIGTWQLTVAAVPHLRASGRGQVVNVSSLAGSRPVGSSIPYACSKAAVSHMTRLLANTLGPDIRVNAVAPGLVDTPVDRGLDGRARVRAGPGPPAARRHPRRRGRGDPRVGPGLLRDRRGRPHRRRTQPALTASQRGAGRVATARGAADGKNDIVRSSPGR